VSEDKFAYIFILVMEAGVVVVVEEGVAVHALLVIRLDTDSVMSWDYSVEILV
jgi:hypothetical protein